MNNTKLNKMAFNHASLARIRGTFVILMVMLSLFLLPIEMPAGATGNAD